ncbi:hypothetical protein SVIOM342S_02668 [Streptomyces violaceorubidus]
MRAVLKTGLVCGLRTFVAPACAEDGPVLGRVAVGRHHFRGVRTLSFAEPVAARTLSMRVTGTSSSVAYGNSTFTLLRIMPGDAPPGCEGGHPGHGRCGHALWDNW